MRQNFSEIFNTNTGGVTLEVGGKMAKLQREMANFSGKIAESQWENGQKLWSWTRKWPILEGNIAKLQRKMAKNSRVAANNGQKQL